MPALKKMLFVFSLIILFENCEKESVIIPVTADFRAVDAEIVICKEVQFSEIANGDVTSWNWTFEEGEPSSSTEENPKVNYTQAGTFSVSLAVSDGITQDQITKTGFITVQEISEPPYEGTVWISPDFMTSADPSTFRTIEENGSALRQMFDGRISQSVEIEALLFNAFFERDREVEMQVNPEINPTEAIALATEFAKIAGQMPAFMFNGVNSISIHAGGTSFYGRNGTITVHAGFANNIREQGFLEEIMLHEGGHATLDVLYKSLPGWKMAQKNDPVYISTYAEDYWTKEDMAESIGPYLAVKYFADRMDEETHCIISGSIPNRIQFFDDQNFDVFPIL